jgi:hypothetical protein
VVREPRGTPGPHQTDFFPMPNARRAYVTPKHARNAGQIVLPPMPQLQGMAHRVWYVVAVAWQILTVTEGCR